MGDYLRSLATRTLTPPSVRPRARSLFEPVKSPFMGMQESGFPEIEQRIRLRETPAPRIVTSHEPSLEPRADRDVAHAEISATPALRRTPTPPEVEPPPAPSSFRHADRGKEEAQPPVVRKNLTRPETVRGEIPNFHEGKEPKIVEQTSERIARIDRVEKQTTLRLQETVRLAAEPGRQNPVDAPTPRGVTTSHESAMPMRPSPPQILPVAALNAAAPEIHVSIGRVIVNARAASAPRLQTAAAAPTIRLTLDQYLRQRGGRP